MVLHQMILKIINYLLRMNNHFGYKKEKSDKAVVGRYPGLDVLASHRLAKQLEPQKRQ